MVKTLPVLFALTVTVPSVIPAVALAAETGEALFKKNCAICHTLEPGKNKVGPSLAGVVGRKAGSVPGFNYSEANKNSGDVWDEQTLEKYLTDPRKFIPGTKMVFAGLKNPEDRKASDRIPKGAPLIEGAAKGRKGYAL